MESKKSIVAYFLYQKFFSDNNQRVFVLGINPSRLGGGITGIPFTEPKNIKEKLGIQNRIIKTKYK